MRLWSKLSRSIGATLEAKFEPDDVLEEAYIRAMTRWSARPQDPEKQYVWLYGIVHEQFCDMLRRVNAVKRGGRERTRAASRTIPRRRSPWQFWQSQTGASTIAARKEFVSRLAGVPGTESEPHRSRDLLDESVRSPGILGDRDRPALPG